MRSRIAQFFFVLAIISALAQAVFGQKTGSGGVIVEKPKVRTEEPVQKTRAAVRVITKVVEKPVTPLTGRLFVAAEPGAVILIEPLNIRGADAQKGTVPDGQRALIFNDLKPGNYRVAATRAGYHEVEKASVLIKRNESQTVTLDFEPILFTVTVQTSADGELKYSKDGEVPKSVDIRNNRTTLYLTAGDYTAVIEPADRVFKGESKQFSVAGNMTVEIPLARMESKETFRAEWTETELKNWDVPAGWRANSGNLIVKGVGVALPRSHYYKNFHLHSDVKIINGVGAAFALRAQDINNYYLLELTGEKADEPLYVRLFTVKGGREQRVQAIKIPNAAAAALKAGQFFSVHIEVTDNRIAVTLVDNQQAKDYPLGVLIDPGSTFAAGLVGVAARGNEESVVWRFIVCTECPKDN
jgi:hypothetical protein